MRNGILLALLVLLTVASCRKHEYPAVLVEADSLCFDNPKAALKLLDSVGKTIDTTQTADWMYYRLVKIKAQDKAYLPHSDMNNIKQLVAYYEKQKDATLLPQAYFYAGRTCHDMNDAPQALDYFHATLDALEQTDDIRLRGITYAQIAYMMDYRADYPTALAYFKKSYQIDSIRRDTTGIIFDLRDCAMVYSHYDQSDSALLMNYKAMSLAKKAKLKDMEYQVKGNLAGHYVTCKHPQKDSVAKYLAPLMRQVKPEAQSGIYAMAARYYALIGKTDSMLLYADSLRLYGNIYGQLKAAELIAKHTISKGMKQQALDAFNQYIILDDSITQIESTEAIQKRQALYDYTQKVKENEKLKHENEKHKFWLIFFGFSIILLALSCYILTYQYKIFKKEQTQKLEELQKIIEQSKHKVASNKESLEAIKLSDIYRCMLKRNQEKSNVIQEEWITLDHAINQHFVNFKNNLYCLCHLSDIEYHICMLLKLEFSAGEIANLVHRSPSALTMARKRLYKKLFHETGKAEDFDTFIHNL